MTDVGHWFGLVFKVPFDILSTYNLFKECLWQLDFSTKTGWEKAFRNKGVTDEVEAEQKEK